ncbi:protein kinase, partial [bacterium]|nr:protein kinase [bacterium]
MRLGPYEVVRVVGKGGMGAVLEARSSEGRRLAIKVLLASVTETGAERFERERRLLSSLSESEGFVPLVDSGKDRGRSYLVMPFLEGGTLRDRLVRGKLAIEETLALGRALASAIGRAHERGIVHRDLKPEN